MPGYRLGAPVELEDVRLHDRDVDAAQQQQILDVAHRALADHRQDTQVVALVEGVGEIRGDAHIGAGDAAGDDPDGGLVDQLALLGDIRFLAAGGTAQARRQHTETCKDAAQDSDSQGLSRTSTASGY